MSGLGPSGNYAGAKGSCTLVGWVEGKSGTIVLTWSSPTGFEGQTTGKLAAKFSGGSGTGSLVGSSITDGQIDQSYNYTAHVHFG